MAAPQNTGDLNNLSKKVTEEVIDLQTSLGSVIDRYKDINKEIGHMSRESRNITSISTKINTLLSETSDLSGKINNQFISRKNIENRINENNTRATETQKLMLINQVKMEGKDAQMYKSRVAALEKLNEQKNILEEISKENLANEEVGKRYNKQFELVQQHESMILYNINMQKDGLYANLFALNEMEQATKKNAEQLNAMNDAIKDNNKEFQKNKFEIVKTILQVLGLGGIFKKIVSYLFEIDTRVTNFANSLNISKDSARILEANFSKIISNSEPLAKNLDTSLRSISAMSEASNQLNDSFGTSVMFSQQTIENQIELTKQLKLSSEEAQGIQTFALMYKKSGEDIVKSIGKQNKGLFDSRVIIKDVSKVGAQLTAQYGNNVEALAKAVILAKKMGSNLEEARKSSEYLLNFEDSIGTELEAELLTGKSLNFEKARALALEGKSAEAMTEMLGQIGSYSNYLKTNVIVQDAMARSIGMTKDELSKTLRTQEVLKSLNYENEDSLKKAYDIVLKTNDAQKIASFEKDIASKKNGEFLLQNIQNLSAQEKFEESMKTVKELLITSLPTITKIVDTFSRLTDYIGLIKIGLVAAAAIMAYMKVLAIQTAIANATSAGVLTGGIAVGLGIAAGVAAAGFLYGISGDSKKPKEMGDGIIEPSGRLSITTPEGGLIIPSKNDYLVATTDPSKTFGGNAPTGNSSSNVESKLTEIANLIRKGGNVYMDSRKVGTAHGLSYSSFA